MNTATNRFSAVFVSFLSVLLMALWSVPEAWADERHDDQVTCELLGGTFYENVDNSYGCSGSERYSYCTGVDVNICMSCPTYGDGECHYYAQIPQSGVPAIPFGKLTPAQQQQARKLMAKHQARLAKGTTKPAQKTYDLRPILNRSALHEGDNPVYTTPEGIGIIARQQGGKLIGWSARNPQGQPMAMRLFPGGTDCWGCPIREGGFVAGGPGDCPIKIVIPGTCPTFPIPPKDSFPASSQPTPKPGVTQPAPLPGMTQPMSKPGTAQPMLKPAITPSQQPGEPMPEGPGRPGEPMKTLPNMNTAPVKK